MVKIVKTKDGFAVYQEIKYMLLFKKWIPFITWMGGPEIYHFSTYNNAMNAAMFKIKNNIITNSKL